MIMISLALLLLSAVQDQAAPAIQPIRGQYITPEEAAEGLTKCGLGPVTNRYDQDLQEDVLIVASSHSPSQSELVCADKATGWHEVEFPPDIQPRFDAIREARATELVQSEARSWLATHHLLDRVPKYVAGVTDDAAFTADIEGLCAAEGAFQSQYGYHALSPDWLLRRGVKPNDDAFACLFNMAAVAGFKFALIGNEAYGQRK
jgi:hypothetical protein